MVSYLVDELADELVSKLAAWLVAKLVDLWDGSWELQIYNRKCRCN